MNPTDLTAEQREIMEHALGMNSTAPGYRNYFASEPGCDGHQHLILLARAGLMRAGRMIPGGLQYFHVTEAGRAAIGAPPALYPEDVCR